MENKKTLLYIGISLGIITTIFSMGGLVLAQSCDLNCVDECSFFYQRGCVGDTFYRTCGNFDCDTCLEWSSPFSCGTDKICSTNGLCVTSCTDHDYKQCYSGDVYWYDSCNAREEKVYECGSDYTGSWGTDYCKGDDIYESRTIYDKGCSGSSCYSYTDTEERLVRTCDDTCSNGLCVISCVDHSYKQCYSGDVYWYDSCSAKEDKYDECGVEEWTGDYQCSGDWIQRKKSVPGCSGDECNISYQWVNYTECVGDQTCSGGTCIEECNSHDYQGCYSNDVYWYDSCNAREEKVDECGSDEWGSNYQCSGDYIQREWTDRGCSGSSCYENTSWLNYQNCSTLGKTCSGGICVWPGLNTTCYANPNPAQEGNSVTFYSTATGGSGSYTYSWSNACTGSSQNCSNTFNNDGSYTANLSVSSGGETDTTSCSVQVDEQPCSCTTWGSWQDQGCGLSTCASGEMYQSRTRSCTNDCASESENQCVSSTSCEPQCTNECSYSGQDRCSGNGTQTCGNYDSDSCLEWGSTQSCSGSTACGYGSCDNDERPNWYCSGGSCGYNCSDDNACGGNDHDYKQCYNNDVYWYSSNGSRDDKYSECGSDYNGSWGSDYCRGDDVYERRTNYDKGCSGSSCYSNTDTEERLVKRCDDDCVNGRCVDDDDDDYKKCYNNDVYWYSDNGYRQSKEEECGSDTNGSWGSDYCKGDNVYEQRYSYDRGCSNDDCFSNRTTEERLVKRCDDDCVNGRCVDDRDECDDNDPCCDNGRYKDDDVVCKSEVDRQYGCPWGISCGADAGVRTKIRYRYCSGDSGACNGDLGNWGNYGTWRVTDNCTANETCSVGKSTCTYNSSCGYTPPSNTRRCEDGDVYWFSPTGTMLSKYDECSDTDPCTQDSCSNATCFNALKCDGTTCSKSSDEYCESCNSCGDGVANCNETFCSCPGDVDFPETGLVAISVLARTEGDYKKNIIAQPEDTIDFLVVVASSADEQVDNIVLDNILPNGIEYKGNLKINGIPFTGNVLTGLGLGNLPSNESKHVTFEAKVADKEEFDTGTTYLSNVSKLTYEGDQTRSDSVGIEVINSGQGVAAAGSIFSQALKIVGSLAFWLVMLFILALSVFLGITGYYWFKKKRLAIYS